jgi:Tfp pilus assembly protein PilN
LWLALATRNGRSAAAAVGALEAQVLQTRTEQQQLDEQLELKKQLTQKEQIIAQLGFPIEMSRLLQTLDAEMPREMSLTEITCTTEEVVPSPQFGAVAAQAKPRKDQMFERRLKIRLVGVAPTDVDLANFLTGLSRYTFFEQIALVRADGLSSGGHIMREFEVTFSINLSAVGT